MIVKAFLKKLALTISLLLLLLSVYISTGCRKQEQKPINPPVPVSAGEVIQKQMPVQIRVIGTVEAANSVSVKAQVGGILTKVHFTEGQDVNKGDILFTIDRRPYEAALKQAEANLTRSMAQAENSKAEEKRYAELVKKGYISQTQYEQVRTTSEALKATMDADKALVENARLNLSYCVIRSPIAGKTGNLMVHEGDLIKANSDSPMVIINQIKPVNVSFSVAEKQLADIKKYMLDKRLKTEAYLQGDDKPSIGHLSFIDNAVDTTTGTIRLKGSFDNNDSRLWPGQFVNVVLTLYVQKNAVVVETRAVQTGQNGQFVFVIMNDSTVQVRPVKVGMSEGNETVIESGLKAGEKIVTDGQLRLSPGAKIEIKDTIDKKTGASNGSIVDQKRASDPKGLKQ